MAGRQGSAGLLFPALLLTLLATPLAAATAGVEAARAYREAHGAEILRRFADLLAIPNVTSDREGVRANAEYLVRQLAERGVDPSLWELLGADPVVVGRLAVPGATRTLGIYVHYDGQPVDAAKWAQAPFLPTLYTAPLEAGGVPRAFPEPGEAIDPEWRLYARSAGDDKAPFAALFAALDALQEAAVPLTSNLLLFFEGEEEAGSTHLAESFAAHRDALDAVDLWLICDGPVHPSRRPQLVFGVRGVTGFELTVYGAERTLHSGHYGNWAPNPALALARLLASFKDERGHVLVAGFYDSTRPPGEAERRALAALPDFDDALRRELGLAATEGDGSLAERLLLPSLNVRGLESGRVGALARNIVPDRAEASLDIRLVAGNDPAAMLDLVETHIRRQGYTIVRQDPDHAARLAHPKLVKVVREGGYPAARTSMEHPLAQRVIAAAREVAGDELVLLPTLGGSLPLYLFTDTLEEPVVIVPIANHDDNQHAPNENLRLANLWYGIDLMGALLTME